MAEKEDYASVIRRLKSPNIKTRNRAKKILRLLQKKRSIQV